jgi:cell division protein FtsQ
VARFLPSARSLAAGIALLVLAGGGYAAARTTAVFAIREIEVEGAPPALARQIGELLGPLAGTSLVALDGDDLVARVEAIPQVLSARYDRAFPHTLVVTVERELPAAVLRRGPESWLVSERGRVIRKVERGAQPRLPRVWVARRVAVERGTIVAAPHAVRGIRAATAVAPGGLPARVRTVRVDERELTFLLASGIELRLGDESDLQLKLAVAARILPALPPPSAGGPRYLDVGVPERAVAGTNSQVEGGG